MILYGEKKNPSVYELRMIIERTHFTNDLTITLNWMYDHRHIILYVYGMAYNCMVGYGIGFLWYGSVLKCMARCVIVKD